MPGTLAVALNREGPRTIDGPAAFETDGSFTVKLSNYGQPVHAHVRPDEALSQVASVEATNHYVDSDDTRYVDIYVDAPEDARIAGRLNVTTNYGAVTHPVEITVDTTGPDEVQVDPDLSKPGDSDEPSLLERAGAVPVVIAFGVAVVLAAAALLAGQTLNTLFGGLAIVALLVGFTIAVANRR